MIWITLLVILFVMIWAITRFYLRAQDLSRFEAPSGEIKYPRARPSEGHQQVLEFLNSFQTGMKNGLRIKKQLPEIRAKMDELGHGKEADCDIIQTSANGVPGEWVIAPDVDTTKRLLYLHGGAFMMGSPKSHRNLLTQLSKRLGVAVFAPDYRLMPEHKRMDGVEDCRTAYRWILENGPDGKSEVSELFVAGDSAGGNLTLSLIAWARDKELRPADAAIALSPITDKAFAGYSVTMNVESDPMLKPIMGFVHKVPKGLVLWISWMVYRIRPNNPVVSPVHGDLSNLPPVLVQASEAEMLLSDGVRYVNKARRHGSHAECQLWPHMAHVWHIFYPDLQEAVEAFDEITRFVETQREHKLHQKEVA